MIRFNNDYNHGAHPEILEALGAINGNSYGGYGEDEWCEKAAELIREKIHSADAAVHFAKGFNGCNLSLLSYLHLTQIDNLAHACTLYV